MLRLLNLADKAEMLALVTKTQMFEKEEISFISHTFENSSGEAIRYGAFQNEKMAGVATLRSKPDRQR